MLSRLFSRRTARKSPVAALLAVRHFRTSVAALGGHDHHDEAPPPHIPRPGSSERTWFGEQKPTRISKDNSYNPGSSDYWSFVGALAGVLLTAVAVKKYTFKEDDDHHGKTGSHGEKKESVKHEEPPVKRVVEKKLVVVPVEEKPVKEEEDTQTPSTSTPSAPTEPTVKALAPGQLPECVPYLLIGGGTASYYAALVIRARNPNAQVLIVSEEDHLPYSRPPLSKDLWWYANDRSREHLEYKSPSGRTRDPYFEAEGFYVAPHELPRTEHGGVSLVRGKRVERVSAEEKKAYLEDGTTISFEYCLLATGGRPKKLAELESASDEVKKRVLYYRGVDDYRKLDEAAATAKSVTVVGGGVLGAELAYGIKRRYKDVEVHQVVRDKGEMPSILPEYLSNHANEILDNSGVKIHKNAKVTGADLKEGRVNLSLSSDSSIETDVIVVAVGIEPNTQIAKASGFKIDETNGGIVADDQLRVSGTVYAAGDVASFKDNKLGRRRNEHWENAMISGRLVGENMTGGEKAFWYQPSFFTKIGTGMLLNAVGDTNSKHETVSVYKKTDEGNKYEKGVIFYVKESKIVGVVLVNVAGSSDVARRLIDDAKEVEDFKEIAKLFPIYENEKKEEKGEEKKKEKE